MQRNARAIIDLALLFLTGFEALVLAELVFDPISGILGRPDNSLVWYDAAIYGWTAFISVVPVILILYGWVLGRAFIEIRKYSTRFYSTLRAILRLLTREGYTDENRSFPNASPRNKLLVLILASAAAAAVGLFPYRTDLNPSGVPVGIDTPQYVSWIGEMLRGSPSQAIGYAFGTAASGSRPLPLLLFYSIAALGVSPDQVVNFSPVILGPLLSLSCYAFVRVGRSGSWSAVMAAIFGGLSFDTTVGIWAGYYANWLAMILGYFFLAAFLALQSVRRPLFYIATLLLSFAILLSHPWTWALLLTATLVFSVMRWRSAHDLSALKIATSLLVVGLIVDLLRTWISGGSTLASDLGTKGNAAGISSALEFWPDLVSTLTVIYDGLLGNFVLLALAALGFFSVLRRRLQNDFDRLLVSWVGSNSIPFVLFNSFHQTRIIYDLPIPVLSSYGLLFLLRRCQGRMERLAVFGLVLLLNANYAVRSVIQA